MSPRRGLSLLESVIATFLLTGSFLVLINLFHAGLRHGNRIEKQQFAAIIASEYMEKLRLWAQLRQSAGFQYENLREVYDGHSEAWPLAPTYQVSTRVSPATLFSPCSQFEESMPALHPSTHFPAGPRKVHPESEAVMLVQVAVNWSGGNQPVSLASYVGRPIAPPENQDSVVIQAQASTPYLPGSGTLVAQGQGLNLTATAFDADHRPIPNVFFDWVLIPIEGEATLLQNRDGSVANVTHRVAGPGPARFRGGSLKVVAEARVHGVPIQATFGPIELAP